MRPGVARYVVTAFEPGVSDVLTRGETLKPRATAFRARRPAPTITVGFEVFVHDVIAAIATEPVRIDARCPSSSTSTAGYSSSPATGPGVSSWEVIGAAGWEPTATAAAGSAAAPV